MFGKKRMTNKETDKVYYDQEQAKQLLSSQLLSILPVNKNQPIVIVCIGTDRSTGDSLGPLVGSMLEEKKSLPLLHIYGTLDSPIHAVNLADSLKTILEKHSDAFIIGVDACLGKVKSIGLIQVATGAVKPGAGVNKELPPVGDAHITGIVNISGFMEFVVLQNTRLNIVMKMSKIIADTIYRTMLIRTSANLLDGHAAINHEELSQ